MKHVEFSLKEVDQTNAEKAEMKVYKQCQLESFNEEVSSLEKHLPLQKNNFTALTHLLKRFIRVERRIGNVFIPCYQKHQLIILDFR